MPTPIVTRPGKGLVARARTSLHDTTSNPHGRAGVVGAASVTVTRTIPTPIERVREAMSDVETFMRAAGFDEVTLDGDRLHIANTAGLFLEIELDVALAGPLLDASVVTRQRRAELRKRFDYLEGLAG